jgi:excinuclease UvrABC nuclease subunit
VHQVRAITWEVCPSAEAAQLRENELLRLHKPRFNVLNTRPEHHAFVGLSWSPAELRLRLTRQAVSEGGERLHGAFKGLGAVRRALAALLRVLWIGQTQTALPHQLPAPLLAPVPPGRFALAVRRGRAEEWGQGVDQFLAGQSNELLGRVAAELPPAAAMCPFQQRLCAQDLECLEDFYRFGPRRSRELRENLGLDAPLIAQHELDDLLVLRQPAEAYRGDTE